MVMVTVVMAAEVVVIIMPVAIHREYLSGALAGAVIPITVQRGILERQVMQALHLPD